MSLGASLTATRQAPDRLCYVFRMNKPATPTAPHEETNMQKVEPRQRICDMSREELIAVLTKINPFGALGLDACTNQEMRRHLARVRAGEMTEQQADEVIAAEERRMS